MPKLNCKSKKCQEDWDANAPSCLDGEIEVESCKNYCGNSGSNDVENPVSPESNENKKLPWSGSALGELDLGWVSQIRMPITIGLLGYHNTGKTTFLATLYMLIRAGKKIGQWSFAGSYTLMGWERIAQFMQHHPHKIISFPPHTSANVSRVPGLLHLLLKNENGKYIDLIFPDAPGEWFQNWAKSADDSSSVGARWIDNNADCYILVADCSAFKESIGKARRGLTGMADRVRNTLSGRPISLVWTKADEDLDKGIKEKITDKVRKVLPDIQPFDVAVVNLKKNDKFILNIIEIINWSINSHFQGERLENWPSIPVQKSEDYFFAIRDY